MIRQRIILPHYDDWEIYAYFAVSKYMTEEIHPDAIDILYNDFEKDFKKEGFVALDKETQEYVNSLWDDLKISSETATYVYVLSGAIAASIVFAIIFFAIRKKIRESTY